MRTIASRLTSIGITLLFAAGTARAGQYVQTNLVSNTSGVAQQTDPTLLNPWGIAYATKGPFWIANQYSSSASVYAVNNLTSTANLLPVGVNNLDGTVPPLPSSLNNYGPTGQVSPDAPGITTNSTDFQISAGGREAAFIFSNLDGSISAWAGGKTTTIEANVVGASFTGLAIGNSGGQAFIYAADQNSTNVDIFNSKWQKIGTLAADPNGLPTGYTAFNVQNINGTLFVTYVNPNVALGGIVDEYSTDGKFLKRLITDTTGTNLQSPWGMAIAPANWGQFGGDLLIGNNAGNGWINAYTLGGTWEGFVTLKNGTPFSEGNLWGMTFGNGGAAGSKDVLYFAAGLPSATGGLFGAVSFVPEPSSAILGLIAVGSLTAVWGWKTRRRAHREGLI
jgi:uncharacterized protein (TIGR03118 family)